MTTPAKVAAPWAIVDGKTISDWTEDWMKWVFHAPAKRPVGTPFGTDVDTSANAKIDNNGPVFFLYGGNWGSDPNHLPTINVPAGKDVLVPMINAFDIESGDSQLSTISNWTQKTHLSYADEARFITAMANASIYDAHLTLTPVGQTKPLINLQWPQTQAFAEDTGIFALGNPQAHPLDYLGSVLTEFGLSLDQHNVPFTEEIGRWAMLTGLSKGDYVLNFGGKGHAVYNPFDHTQQIFGSGGNDWTPNTTEILHVG